MQKKKIAFPSLNKPISSKPRSCVLLACLPPSCTCINPRMLPDSFCMSSDLQLTVTRWNCQRPIRGSWSLPHQHPSRNSCAHVIELSATTFHNCFCEQHGDV